MNKLFPIVLALLFFGCDDSTSPENVYGCTDETACNFNPDANIYVPNSCIYGEVNLCNQCGDSYECLYGVWNYQSQVNDGIDLDNEGCDIDEFIDYEIFGNITVNNDGTLDWSIYDFCDEYWDWMVHESSENRLLLSCGVGQPPQDGGFYSFDFALEVEIDYGNSNLIFYEGQSQTDEYGNYICSTVSEIIYTKNNE